MIISVHMPKCGGTSFGELLKNHFHLEFIQDYNDKPMSKPFDLIKIAACEFKNKFDYDKTKYRKACIHGHFLPYKYSSFLNYKNSKFVTWLRDPYERIASNYYYWKSIGKVNLRSFDEFRKKVILDNWSFEKFCFCSERQNIYYKYFWNFPLENFDFIGITEYFSEDILFFARNFLEKSQIIIPTKNVNPNKRKPHIYDQKFLEEFKKFHSKDYTIYQSALYIRQIRSSMKNIDK